MDRRLAGNFKKALSKHGGTADRQPAELPSSSSSSQGSRGWSTVLEDGCWTHTAAVSLHFETHRYTVSLFTIWYAWWNASQIPQIYWMDPSGRGNVCRKRLEGWGRTWKVIVRFVCLSSSKQTNQNYYCHLSQCRVFFGSIPYSDIQHPR